MRNLFIQFWVLILVLFMVLADANARPTPPTSFDEAKRILKQVYKENPRTVYCDCEVEFYDRGTGGRIDPQACGITNTPGWANRLVRLEYEHINPVSKFGVNRPCWKEGGRENCGKSNDAEYRQFNSDPHMLTLSVGAVNAARSNYDLKELPNAHYEFTGCEFKYDRQTRGAEPRDEAKGFLARAKLYAAARYSYYLSIEQQTMLVRWHETYPPNEWEKKRNIKISEHTGTVNPFITGAAQWVVHDMNINTPATPTPHAIDAQHMHQRAPTTNTVPKTYPKQDRPTQTIQGIIIGNKNSNIYHLPTGCPSYSRVGESNRVYFNTEQEAINAGFRKAANCN